jgi:hypothetical protein
MPSMNIAKQISETIKEQASNDESLKEFILAILKWELSTKGTFQFKENYRQMIKQYSSKWEAEK